MKDHRKSSYGKTPHHREPLPSPKSGRSLTTGLRSPKKSYPDDRPRDIKTRKGAIFLYGLHAVEAALSNKERIVHRLWITKKNQEKLSQLLEDRALPLEIVTPRDIDKEIGADAIHQGILMEAAALPNRALEELRGDDIVLVLDQMTDPHNVGAILRSAAAFGAGAVIMTERHSPPLSGVLAKSASGALEYVAVLKVKNLSRALKELGERGYWRIGLEEGASCKLETMEPHGPIALVLGAEGQGLRRLTREHCDQLAGISTAGKMQSLNVSNAAAVALHTIGVLKAVK